MLILNLSAVAAILALLVHRRLELQRLGCFLRGLELEGLSPVDVSLSLAGRLFAVVTRSADPYYICQLLAPLGASPGAVIRSGGCCSGVTRLYVVALERCGIESAQITVYDQQGIAKHCLAEVRTDGETMIVDPHYGIRYGAEDGTHLSLEALQAGRAPFFYTVPGSSAAAYPDDPYYDFDYAETKTANWTKSFPRRVTYAALRLGLGERADRLRVPPLLEWPHTLLAAAIAGGMVLTNAAILLGG